ncbi:glycosyltransferase [Variovorax sp. ZT5P49]|uniref:glycosyltransferase n=1 Tax=Variovorax sp. ZT5P49 TaxID=3443733 RepID=UPI003F46E0E5
MQLTNGFDAPPVEFPAFDDHARGPLVNLARSQGIERLSETIHRVGKDFGVELCLEKFFAWPRKLSDAIPETDPYGARADFSYAGPFTLERAMSAPRWPKASGRSGKHAFAYLRGGMASVGAVLEALRLAGVATCCVWPDATDVALHRYEGSCIQIDRSPVRLTEALERADVVVNYGSGSVVCSTVLAGKAQLMMPMDVEKLMFARRVEGHGAGITWMPRMGAVAASVRRLLDDESLTVAASAIAKRHSTAQLIRTRDAAVDAFVSGISGR